MVARPSVRPSYPHLSDMSRLILAVDDQPENLAYIRHSLRHTPHEVVAIDNAPEALKVAKERKPDIMLVDIVMPDMDGFEFVEAISKVPDLQDVPVVFITAMDNEEYMLRATRLGVSNYLTKPYTESEVLELIDLVMV